MMNLVERCPHKANGMTCSTGCFEEGYDPLPSSTPSQGNALHYLDRARAVDGLSLVRAVLNLTTDGMVASVEPGTLETDLAGFSRP